MAPAKVDDDPVIAEYNVFLTPPIQEHIYLLQYPNRPRTRPYSHQYGSAPHDMRIKPKTGFLEMDVKLNTEHNFNKYMGLKWGDANKAARELHNASGTYGLAAGLTGGKPRSMHRGASIKDKADREFEFESDLSAFKDAEQANKVHSSQTLGGQIIRHDAPGELGKPLYFVGAFQNDQLHLTKVTGTVQMRPHFHHLDAEEERTRVAVSRAQAEAAGPTPESAARAVTQQFRSKQEQDTVENKLKKALTAAGQEPWISMDYIDEEEDVAWEEFEKKLKVKDASRLPHLKSGMDDDAYLDAISAPRHNSPTRRRKRAPKSRETVELEDDEVEMQDNGVVAEAAAESTG